MDFEFGLARLQQLLPSDAIQEFAVFEMRLRDNLRRERLYGSTEGIRAERAEISAGLNQIALTHLEASFNDLCRRDFEVTFVSSARSRAEKPNRSTPHPEEEPSLADENLRALWAELDTRRDTLRLIQERKAEYVFSTDVPLNLIKEERQLLDRIAEIEQQLTKVR